MNCNTHTAQYLTIYKNNQTMKLGQLMDIPREIFFFKKYAENEAGKLVPVHFLFFKKTLY